MDQSSYTVERFGIEGEPVIIIDGFYGAADDLIRAGRSADYDEVSGYPGIRSAINPKAYVANAKKSSVLAKALRTEFGFEGQLRFESCAFSIVALQPHQLSHAQRLPHFDEAYPNLIALVHYLASEKQSGTAFYRHKRTGFETVQPARFDQYKEAQKRDDEEFGVPPAQFHRGTSDRYEWIGEAQAAPDRLIAYRAQQLHSGNILDVPPAEKVVSQGRLTITAFVLGT